MAYALHLFHGADHAYLDRLATPGRETDEYNKKGSY
jgi:hypothetical protein